MASHLWLATPPITGSHHLMGYPYADGSSCHSIANAAAKRRRLCLLLSEIIDEVIDLVNDD